MENGLWGERSRGKEVRLETVNRTQVQIRSGGLDQDDSGGGGER